LPIDINDYAEGACKPPDLPKPARILCFGWPGVGFYPAPSGIEHFQNELSVYVTSKGAIQFPIDQPIPYDLIGRIVKFRVQENLETAAAKKKKKA
jgi:hypothetical protein